MTPEHNPSLLRLRVDEGSTGLTDQEQAIIQFRVYFEQIEGAIAYALSEYASREGMDLMEGLSLRWVYDLGDQAKIGAIADKLRIPLSTMTGVANRLESNNLVERHRAPDDGRAFVLRLTDEGMSRLDGMFVPFFNDVTCILGDEGESALPQMIEGFERVSRLSQKLEAKVREESSSR